MEQTEYGKLTVLGESDKSSPRRRYWRVQCICGTIKDVVADSVKRGDITSCGCQRAVRGHNQGLANRTHGLSGTREYFVHKAMMARCYDPKQTRWERYGGRGIAVCIGWHDLTNFYEDMAPRPTDKHTLERIDNDGNYSCGKCIECLANDWPKNVKWATKAEQSRNNSRTRLITFNGKTQCVMDWAIELGISYSGLKKRLAQWPIEKALTMPVNPNYQH
jgi:hypothetical protein